MEKKEMNDAMGGRRLLPPLYPGSPTNVPRAGNSHPQHHSRRRPLQHNPAATAYFASQAGSGSSWYQQPPSPLYRMTHASAGVGGGSSSSTGSGYAGGSSSSTGTGLASVVGLAPLSWSVDQASSESGLPTPLLTQSTADNMDLGFTDEYLLPPLPPSLVGPQAFQAATVVDLEAVHAAAPVYISLVEDDGDSGNKSVQYVDLEGPGGGLNTSAARYRGNTSTKAPCLSPLASPSWSLRPVPAPAADPSVKKEVEDWSSWGTSQLRNNSIANGGSSSAWMSQQPYSSSNTRNGITKGKAPVQLLTPSSSIPAPAANVQVKKEAMDWSWHTSTQQRGKNTITSGGSSSANNNDLVVLGSKRKLRLPSQGSSSSRGRGGDSSSNQWMDDANAPFIADFADGLFTQNDIDKIMTDKGLVSIVLTDPKSVRRILNNRSWSETYRQKKVAHVSDLERQAERLQQENKSLSARVQSLQSTVTGLTAEKNEMMIKLYGFQQEIKLKNDMNKTLNDEVNHLKLILGESMGSHVPNNSSQERCPQVMQSEHPRKHNHQLAQIQHEKELQELDNFIKK